MINIAEIYGMIHLPNLRYHSSTSLEECIRVGKRNSSLFEELQYDGVILENFNDRPFNKNKVSEIVLSKLAIIAREIKNSTEFKVGINILRNACNQAMTISSVLNLDFIRCNIWEGAYVTDQGIIEGVASQVMDLKNKYRANVLVFADVFVKHASPLGKFSIVEAAEHALDRGGAERVILSGMGTGKETSVELVEMLNNVNIFPMIGSGLKVENLTKYAGKISGGIVGTSIKTNIHSLNIDQEKARKFINAWKEYF